MQISEAVDKGVKAQMALHNKEHASMVLGRAPRPLIDQHSAMYVAPYRLAQDSVEQIAQELGLTEVVELMNGPPGHHVRAIVLECRDSEGERVVLKIGEPATQCKANAQWSTNGVPVPRVIASGTAPAHYFLTDFVEGVSLQELLPQREQRPVDERVVTQVAAAVRLMHQGGPVGADSWWRERSRLVQGDLDALKELGLRTPVGYRAAVSKINLTKWPEACSHADIGRRNVMVDSSGSKLVAIIDGEGPTLPIYWDASMVAVTLSGSRTRDSGRLNLAECSKLVGEAYPELDEKMLDLWIGYQVLANVAAQVRIVTSSQKFGKDRFEWGPPVSNILALGEQIIADGPAMRASLERGTALEI